MFTCALKACLLPEVCRDQENGTVWGQGRYKAHGVTLRKAERVKCSSVVLPKFFSGISGDPRVSDLTTPPETPSATAVFQLEGPATER